MAKNPNWSETDDKLLIEHYALKSKEFICSLFPGRPWSGIKQHAYGKLGLKKETTERTKNGDASKLLEETPEAYYWMGFLLADGSFDKLGRISISVSEKDLGHLKKFGIFISTDKILRSERKTNFSDCAITHKISCYSAFYGPKIIEKFGLKLNKTENPPDLQRIFSNTTKENALALIIGFIDGDGTIQYANSGASNFIKIEVHSSWLNNLKLIEEFVYQYFEETSPNSSKLNTRGYASLFLSRASMVQKLKTFSKNYPIVRAKMDENTKARLKKLDLLSFNSLDMLGIKWRDVIKNNPKLETEYLKYLSTKNQWVVVNLDYNQLELYVLASISGDPTMIATVNTGKDIHSENTKNIYKIDYEALEKELDILPEGSDRYKEVVYILKDFKTKRKSTKALSFSLSYGAGKEKIAMDNKITVLDAQKLIDGFYDIYPQVKTWQNTTFLSAIQNGYLETPFGRRRATPKIHNRMDAYRALVDEDAKAISKLKKEGEYWSLREEFKTCKNTPIQSVASDMCSWAAHKFKEWLKTANLRAQMLFWVHDSIVAAVHIDDAITVINRCLEIMENEVKYPNDPVNYRGGLDLGFNYEWTVEVSRKEWFVENQRAVLEKKLDESLDLDLNKKFKLIVKSSSNDIMNASTYIPAVRETKQEYFEAMVEKLGLNVHSPTEYMAMMNSCSVEEYENYFNSELNIEAADD